MKAYSLLLLALVLISAKTGNGKADEYYVMKTTTNCNCTVQLSTASPIGKRHKGPFSSKDEARKAMCADIDPGADDLSKCWTATPAGACK